MRRPLPGWKLVPRSASICLILTRRLGATTSSFISASRSVPPARMYPCSPSSVATCSFFVGVTYSNSRIATPDFVCGAKAPSSLQCPGRGPEGPLYPNALPVCPTQRFEHAIGCERQEGHAHADGIGDCVGNRRAGRDHRRLGQSDDAALVVALASHHVHV